jgi:hypothetical protein
MRIVIAAGLTVAALAGCGGQAVSIDPNAKPVTGRWNATLATPAGLAGAIQVRGLGWMAGTKDSTETTAHVEITNSAPGGQHPWHVHLGQCGNDRGILGEANAYPVLKVGGNGKADADAKLNIPTPRGGQYFINVHASAANMGTIVACGNLAPPAP